MFRVLLPEGEVTLSSSIIPCSSFCVNICNNFIHSVSHITNNKSFEYANSLYITVKAPHSKSEGVLIENLGKGINPSVDEILEVEKSVYEMIESRW